MPPADQPVVLLSTPRVAAAAWRDFYVDVWRAPAGVADVRLTTDAQIAIARRLRGKVVALSVMLPAGVGLPDATARKALDAALIEIGPHTKAAALALLTTGFSGAIYRSIYIAAKVLTKSQYPMQITSTVAEACTFLAPYSAARDSGIDLAEVVALAQNAEPFDR